MMSLLETALALLGVVLVLALAAESLQEIVKSSLALKGHTTLQALEHLVTEAARANSQTTTDAEEIVKAIRRRLRALGHRGVRSNGVRIDSISSEQLGDLIRSVAPDEVRGLRALEPGEARRRLQAIAVRAVGWFPLAMAPLDDRYRRRMRGLAIASSAVVVLAVNADAFAILRRARQDPIFRERVLALATRLDSLEQRSIAGASAAAALPSSGDSASRGSARGDSAPRGDSAARRGSAARGASARDDSTRVASAGVLALQSLAQGDFVGGPDGWQPKSYSWWIGILLTIALVSLGAPFWHDALEALFGLKTRLRAQTRDIEQRTRVPSPAVLGADYVPGVRAPDVPEMGSSSPIGSRRRVADSSPTGSGGP
jgi:hypothetical protein